jgi:hypothetical protein
MDLINKIEMEEMIKEAAYSGNIGFQEMVTFYQKASDKDIKKLEAMIKRKSWEGVKKLFKNILGIELK